MNGHAKWEYIIHATDDIRKSFYVEFRKEGEPKLQLRGSGMYGGLCFSFPEYW